MKREILCGIWRPEDGRTLAPIPAEYLVGVPLGLADFVPPTIVRRRVRLLDVDANNTVITGGPLMRRLAAVVAVTGGSSTEAWCYPVRTEDYATLALLTSEARKAAEKIGWYNIQPIGKSPAYGRLYAVYVRPCYACITTDYITAT